MTSRRACSVPASLSPSVVNWARWRYCVAFLAVFLSTAAAGDQRMAGLPPSDASRPGASWPSSILVDVGDIETRIESRSFWTLYRVDYRGGRIGIDAFGSHYGTVVSFPEIGFIGSGHTENENEQVLSLRIDIDGEEQLQPADAIQAKSVRLHKRSRIRSLIVETDIVIEGDRIVEDVVLKADAPTPVNRIYHFMHPWTPTATEFAAERADGEMISGAFNGQRDFKVDAPTRWSAVYDEPTGKGAVIIVLDTPEDEPWKTWYWDIDGRYRKHYLVTFLNQTVPPGRDFRYRVAIVPFAAEKATWREEARRIGQTG